MLVIKFRMVFLNINSKIVVMVVKLDIISSGFLFIIKEIFNSMVIIVNVNLVI